ncbi:MAG: HAD family hydrolase [Anaerolineales bacterium]|nr:HAD family hydrolase [Anaerolineales bacterium]
MAVSSIKHILFDLGGTLMRAKKDWADIHHQADEALVNKLNEYDIQLNAKVFRARLEKYYNQRDMDFRETTYHFVLLELLKELNYAEVSESILRSALDAMYAITQTNWELEKDCLETLRSLKKRQFHLGIFSNAGDDKDVQQLIQNFGIRDYFDFVLTSAACYYRKPHARAFEIALAQWNIMPQEAVMIGDSLVADIYGAKKINMKTIWITRRAQFTAEDMHRFKPDFSLRKLSELLPTLDLMNMKRMM